MLVMGRIPSNSSCHSWESSLMQGRSPCARTQRPARGAGLGRMGTPSSMAFVRDTTSGGPTRVTARGRHRSAINDLEQDGDVGEPRLWRSRVPVHTAGGRPFFAGDGLQSVRWMNEMDDGVAMWGGNVPGERGSPLEPSGPVCRRPRTRMAALSHARARDGSGKWPTFV